MHAMRKDSSHIFVLITVDTHENVAVMQYLFTQTHSKSNNTINKTDIVIIMAIQTSIGIIMKHLPRANSCLAK